MADKKIHTHMENDTDKKQPKKHNKAGFLLTTAMIASMIIGTLWDVPVYSQQVKKIPQWVKKPSTEIVKKTPTAPKIIEAVDTSFHEKIITTNMDSILVTYGKEKWLNIIREHMVIEINKLRKLYNQPPVTQDSTLNIAAQNFAEYGSPYGGLWHSFNGKNVYDMWIDPYKYIATAENVSYGKETIASVIESRYKSKKWHKETMLGLNISEYTWKKLDYALFGFGYDNNFSVGEFGNLR